MAAELAFLPHYALALALTLAVEIALAARVAPPATRRRVVRVAWWLNLTTHPALWLIGQHVELPLLGAELGVVLPEWLAYRCVAGLGWGRAGLLSVLANAASAWCGVLLW